ncbi:uncharacterized protein DS421_18g611530 [Arachis hypogaea]|nr:uncharacterized protein DS421_18g611530 [Arachis hypogaea]
MSEEKKMIVRDLGFGGLMHIPPLRVHHQVLRELANNFKLGENRLETGYGSFKIRPKTIGDALGINASKRNWGGYVLSFIIKGIIDYKEKKKKAIDGYLFALMIIYFHPSKNKDKKRAERPPKSWIANWKTTDSDNSTSESETQEDSEDSPRKEPSKKGKKTQSKKKKVVVEDSSPEQPQSYHGSEIGSEDLDELLRKNNENSAAQGLSLVEESASEPADSNMMIVREETPSKGLAIVPIQVYLPVSQTTTVPEFEETPETEYEPTPLLQIEGTTKTNPAPEDAAALMMMAQTASYVPKTDPMPSFSLGFTDSSQEETTTQEGASTQDEHMAKTSKTPKLLEQLEDLVHKIVSDGVTKEEKSPQIPKESGAESFEKFETPVRPNLNTTDMKQKCYHWAIRVKSYSNGLTDEFDNICRLQVQDRYTLSKFHLASLAPKTHIEAEIVFAMCFIVNQQNIQRFQEEVYCLPPDIVNMALANHPEGVFLQPKNNKPFRVEDYPMFIPFLDLQKLKSHRYIFAPVCHSHHWWLWVADTRKRKFYIVDPLHNKSPSDARIVLNTFVGYVISRIKVYAGGEPLKSKDKDREIVAPYLHISGQKTSYDCAIYVMKWLEIFEPTNIKRRKYEWDNWTQDEVDHFRVEYAS